MAHGGVQSQQAPQGPAQPDRLIGNALDECIDKGIGFESGGAATAAVAGQINTVKAVRRRQVFAQVRKYAGVQCPTVQKHERRAMAFDRDVERC